MKHCRLLKNLSEDEIDAIKKEFSLEDDVDKYFLLKLQIVLTIALVYACLLLVDPRGMSAWLVPSGIINGRPIDLILHSRGVFIILGALAVIYSFKSRFHTTLIFGSAAIIVVLNLLSDLLIFYSSSEFSLKLILVLLLRILTAMILISLFKNHNRIPTQCRKVLANPFKL